MATNMKELKDALNKLPDDKLKNYYLWHGFCLEDADEELKIVFFCDEEQWDAHREMFNNPAMRVLEKFAKETDETATKLAKAKEDEQFAESLCADIPN